MVLSAIIIFLVFFAIYAVIVVLDVLKAKKKQQKYHIKRAITAGLFLLPATALAFFFVLLPILYSLGYSFTNYNLLKPENITYAGLNNFAKAFKEIADGGKLAYAIRNTAIFVVLVVPLQIGLALLLALFCNAKMRGNTIFKVCFFAPVVISLTITSYLWLQILAEGEGGMLNSLLSKIGISPKRFLTDPDTAMIWIVVVSLSFISFFLFQKLKAHIVATHHIIQFHHHQSIQLFLNYIACLLLLQLIPYIQIMIW